MDVNDLIMISVDDHASSPRHVRRHCRRSTPTAARVVEADGGGDVWGQASARRTSG
jgi:hypothetical protein